METLAKPYQLRVCLILMVVTLVYSLIHFIAFIAPAFAAYYKINVFVFYMSDLVITFFFGYLLYKMYRGRPWARIVWSLLTIFGIFVGLSSTFDYEKYPVVVAFIGTIIAIADIIVLVLLWHPATTRWFKAMKAARLTTPESTSAETTESSENVDDNLQTATDSTMSVSESTHSGISYNKLLKVLRVIRVIYILSVIQTLINIATFYGLAVNIIGRFPMPQNNATLINVDRSVAMSLLITLLISLGYILIENLIDKKLQSYPQETIDRSYSKKAILFLSFLYTYFFFSLNNRIVVSFIIMNYINDRPRIVPIIYVVVMNLAALYFVFRYLIQKIENKKTWRNYWIAAVCSLPFMMFFVGFSENFLANYGIDIFTKPVLFIINTLKSIFGAAS